MHWCLPYFSHFSAVCVRTFELVTKNGNKREIGCQFRYLWPSFSACTLPMEAADEKKIGGIVCRQFIGYAAMLVPGARQKSHLFRYSTELSLRGISIVGRTRWSGHTLGDTLCSYSRSDINRVR